MHLVSQQERADLNAYKQANPELAHWLITAEQTRQATQKDPFQLPQRPSITATVEPLPYLHGYYARSGAGADASGQAAVATLLDYHGLNPYGLVKNMKDSLDGRRHYANDALVGRIRMDYGPDVPISLGTSGRQIRDALRGYGLRAETACSGGVVPWQKTWLAVRTWAANHYPVICSLDTGKVGGSQYNATWAVVYRVTDGLVYFANWEHPSWVVSEETFLSAWHNWFLPYGYNHCAVFAQR